MSNLLRFSIKFRQIIKRYMYFLHHIVKEIEPWGMLISVVALTLAAMTFVFDYQERVRSRVVDSWQLLTTHATGNSGKIQALEYLNSEAGFFCTQTDPQANPLRGAAKFGQFREPTCVVTVKKPESLLGIDLSPENDNSIMGAYLKGISIPGADLRNSNLRWANLEGANLEAVNLSSTDLFGANLRNANLKGAFISLSRLDEADLAGAQLSGSYINGSSLRHASLNGANLEDATLIHSDLTSSNFSGAFLVGTNVLGSVMRETNISSAILSNNIKSIQNLSQTHLDGAILLRNAIGLDKLVDPMSGDLLVARSFVECQGIDPLYLFRAKQQLRGERSLAKQCELARQIERKEK